MRTVAYDLYDPLDAALAEVPQDEPEMQADEFAAGRSFSPDEKEAYAAKRKAEREAVFDKVDQSALAVAGDGEMLRKYLDLQTRLKHANPKLKTEGYTETNVLLVLEQKPNASRLADFNYWKSIGCPVTSGPGSGISILVPGNKYVRDDGIVSQGYNVKKVFDISQVDTRNFVAEAPPRHTEEAALRALVKYAPISIERAEELPNNAGAIYDHQKDAVVVRRGMAVSDTFKELSQAMAYGLMTTGPDVPADPQLSAACASYMLCKQYGIATQSFDFSDTPEVWGDMDALAVKSELTEIRDIASNLSERMARTLEPQDRGARDDGAR